MSVILVTMLTTTPEPSSESSLNPKPVLVICHGLLDEADHPRWLWRKKKHYRSPSIVFPPGVGGWLFWPKTCGGFSKT